MVFLCNNVPVERDRLALWSNSVYRLRAFHSRPLNGKLRQKELKFEPGVRWNT